MDQYTSEPTRADDWEVPEGAEIDLSRPLEIAGETDWPPLPSLNAPTAGKIIERKPQKSGEGIMAKAWVAKLRSGWTEQPSYSWLGSLSFASMISGYCYRDADPVHANPPVNLLYTDEDSQSTLVVHSAQKWYVPLPVDPLAHTDISQLLQVPYTFVDTEALVRRMLDALPTYHSETPLLSIDLEGLDLGKSNGETYLMQIYDCKAHHLYTIDILTLGRKAFQTSASAGKWTLRKLLQSAWVLKLFCDIRGDSRALFTQFGIHLRGIKDIQNIELASRREPHRRHWRHGLVRLIESYGSLSWDEQRRFRM